MGFRHTNLNFLGMYLKNRLFKILFVLFFISSLAIDAKAQDKENRSDRLRIGVRGGFNVTNLVVENALDHQARLRFNIGLVGRVKLTNFIQFQTEILYNTKGGRVDYRAPAFDGRVIYGLRYLEVPFLALLNFGDVFNIHGGLYTAYLTGALISPRGQGNVNLVPDDLSTFDLGWNLGFEIRVRPVNLGFRYMSGFINLTGGGNSPLYLEGARNSGVQVYVLFMFNDLFDR